jgi:F0F1-type ATP synthase epsilon subunit
MAKSSVASGFGASIGAGCGCLVFLGLLIGGCVVFIVNMSKPAATHTSKSTPPTPTITNENPPEKQTDETKEETKKETAKPKIYNEGENVNVGYTTYVVWHSWWSNRLSENQFLNQRPNAMYLFVELTVRNDDKKSRMVPPFTLLDENEQEYEASSNAWAVEGSIGVIESLNPSVSKQGFVVFDVPHDHTYRLKLSGGYWSLQDAYVQLTPKSSRDAAQTEEQERQVATERAQKRVEKERKAEIDRQTAKERAEEIRKAKTRNWTDATGKFSVNAEYLYMIGNEVSLKKADGKTIKIPLEKLNTEDQKWIEEWKKGKRD